MDRDDIARILAQVEAKEAAQVLFGDNQPAGGDIGLITESFGSQNHVFGTIRPHSEISTDPDEEFIPEVPTIGQIFTLEQGRAMKKHKKLSAESEAESECFLHTSNPVQHAFMTHLVLLEIRDIAKGIRIDNMKNYQVPETLKKTVQDYAHVAILSPSAQCYRGQKLAEAVLKAMRELNVAEVPPSRETGHCELVQALISKGLTDWRHHVKNVIAKSLVDTENKQDIATLTAACIGNSKVKATAPLYIRLAFLRSHLKIYLAKGSKKDKGEDFWMSVDGELANWRQIFSTPSRLQFAFSSRYDEDIKEYGQPDDTQPLTAIKDLDDWLATVNTHSSRIITNAASSTPTTPSTPTTSSTPAPSSTLATS